jgi:protein-disulfide isomerase
VTEPTDHTGPGPVGEDSNGPQDPPRGSSAASGGGGAVAVVNAPRGISGLAALAIALIAALVGYTVGATTGGDGATADQPVAVQDAGGGPAATGGADAADTATGGADAADTATGGADAADTDSADDAGAEEAPANPLDVRPVLGSADAPITIDVFSDFGCPFCHRHDEEVEPELIARYVETGQARLVWYDVPFQGPTSVRLHVAARAAQRQDLFWEFKEAVFRTSDGRDASPETLRTLAAAAGLDVERFETDLEDPALEQLVLGDLQAAQSAGVTGTPTFLVGGQPVVGAQPLSAFTEAMDEALQTNGA